MATAKFWGIMPHVLWGYPFRYFKELRDFYIASVLGPVEEPEDPDDRTITVEGDEGLLKTIDMEMVRGDAV